MKTIGIVLLLSITACGKEMGRVPFSAEGSGSTTITLKAGEVAFWTDLDIEYTGGASLGYEVSLAQGGAEVATAKCDPLGSLPAKTSWVETNIGDQHSRRGNGKMTCTATLAAGGPTVVTAKLSFGTKPKTLTLKKADLALRQ